MSTLVIRQPSLLDEFEGMTQELWTTWEPWTEGHYMRLDVQDTGDELVVKAELPGVGKDGFGITIEGDELHIEAEKKAEEEVEEGTYYLRERHFGKFSRTLTLPFPVDGRKASATLENGVLEIRPPNIKITRYRFRTFQYLPSGALCGLPDCGIYQSSCQTSFRYLVASTRRMGEWNETHQSKTMFW